VAERHCTGRKSMIRRLSKIEPEVDPVMPISENRAMMQITRSELYDKVWTTPMSRLSKEFGISDVALAKVCKKYDIPRPPRGFWARLQNGYRDKKAALPKGENRTIEFDVESNQRNRREIQLQKEKEEKRKESVKPVIEVAENLTHPLAKRFLERIENVNPDTNGILKMKRVGLPQVEIAEDSVDRVARFLTIIAYMLEEWEVSWKKSAQEGAQSLFSRDDFEIGIHISQALEKEEREPTLEEKRKPSWEWDLTVYKPADKITIVLKSKSSISGRKKWTESNANDVVALAPKIAGRIDDLLRGLEEARIAAIEWEKRREAQKIIDAQNRRKQARLDHIEEIKLGRTRELVRASMLWKEHQVVSEFVDACEARWGDSVTPEQTEWVNWARAALADLCPFSGGYPDPAKHGPLDESTIEEKEYYHSREEVFVRKTQLLKDIKNLSERRGYGCSSW